MFKVIEHFFVMGNAFLSMSKEVHFMERGTTLFLKIAVFIIGTPVLALCIFGLPGIAARDAAAHPETAYYLP
jgi:hypothetical protein